MALPPLHDTNDHFTGHKLEHYQQRYSWDCGVACVLMLLSPQQREAALSRFTEICQEEGYGKSTWTIDLCYLLKRFNIDHCMYTIRRGVNESYRKKSFYSSVIDLDADRVRRRFREAEGQGIRVVEHQLSDQELLHHVLTRGPAIVLVDYTLLSCDLCKHNKLKAEFRRMFGGRYHGHYVVVVGAAGARRLLRDPARPPRLCALPAARLAAARAAAGTDGDAVLVYRDYR